MWPIGALDNAGKKTVYNARALQVLCAIGCFNLGVPSAYLRITVRPPTLSGYQLTGPS